MVVFFYLELASTRNWIEDITASYVCFEKVQNNTSCQFSWLEVRLD